MIKRPFCLENHYLQQNLKRSTYSASTALGARNTNLVYMFEGVISICPLSDPIKDIKDSSLLFNIHENVLTNFISNMCLRIFIGFILAIKWSRILRPLLRFFASTWPVFKQAMCLQKRYIKMHLTLKPLTCTSWFYSNQVAESPRLTCINLIHIVHVNSWH